MNLIDNPTVISEDEAALIGIQQDRDAVYAATKDATVRAFRRIWHEGRTAQRLAVMGTRARAAFEAHAAAVQFLLTVGVHLDPADYTPPVPYTVHADGTITLD